MTDDKSRKPDEQRGGGDRRKPPVEPYTGPERRKSERRKID